MAAPKPRERLQAGRLYRGAGVFDQELPNATGWCFWSAIIVVPLEVTATDRVAARGVPAEPAAFAVWLALRKRTALNADWVTPQHGASVVQYGGQSGARSVQSLLLLLRSKHCGGDHRE